MIASGEKPRDLLLNVNFPASAARGFRWTRLGKRRYRQAGRRVVEGQRLMQAASDIFLGWSRGRWAGHHYYWRQLKDWKYSVDVDNATRELQHKVTEVAIKELEHFVEQNPNASLSKDARDQIRKLREKEAENIFVVGEFYEKQKRPDAAKIYYAEIVDEYQDTAWATKALKRIRELNTK